MNAVVRFWRGDRRPIQSKRLRSAPSDDRNSLEGKPDGQAEGTTCHYSRVDGTYARETTIRPAGTGFCKSQCLLAGLSFLARKCHPLANNGTSCLRLGHLASLRGYSGRPTARYA